MHRADGRAMPLGGAGSVLGVCSVIPAMKPFTEEEMRAAIAQGDARSARVNLGTLCDGAEATGTMFGRRADACVCCGRILLGRKATSVQGSNHLQVCVCMECAAETLARYRGGGGVELMLPSADAETSVLGALRHMPAGCMLVVGRTRGQKIV